MHVFLRSGSERQNDSAEMPKNEGAIFDLRDTYCKFIGAGAPYKKWHKFN